MRSYLRTILVGILIGSALSFAVITPVYAQTQEWSGVCVAENITGGDDVATIQGLQCLIANIFTIIITVIGLAGFVMFIWGSFTWLLSGGNPKGVENARNTMMFAVVGLIVALSGFIILNLISAFTGVDVTQFLIPGPGDTAEVGKLICGQTVSENPATSGAVCNCSTDGWQQVDGSTWKCGR